MSSLATDKLTLNSDITAKYIAESVDSLYTFPDVATKILDQLKDEQSGLTEIGELVKQDVALSAAILRIGNSASNMQMDGTVTDVSRALNRVGGKQLADLVYGICIPQATSEMKNEVVELQDFWIHSLYTANIAQLLANEVRRVAPATAFTAGLLHDLGQLAMFRVYPDESKAAIRESMLREIDMSEAEIDIFGFSHEEVGLELCTQWGIPDALKQCVTTHHDPEQVVKAGKLAMITYLASKLADAAETEEDPVECMTECSPEVLAELFDEPVDPTGIIENAIAQCDEMRSSIIPTD